MKAPSSRSVLTSITFVFGAAARRQTERLLQVVACAAVLLGDAARSQALPGWNLVWADEFDAAALDELHWEALTRRDSYNNEKQYYLPEQVTVSDGALHLTATDEPLDGKLYRSGRIWTTAAWSYGRFEARMMLPTTQGLWPAFWLLPRDASWPSGGEIDIMENRGSQPTRVSAAYHWGATAAAHRYVSSPFAARDATGDPLDFHAEFHTYAAAWEPGVIRFYVDDLLHFTVTESEAPIHSTAKSIVLNLAVGGDFGGDPNATTQFPQQLSVDYVRVWQRSATPSVSLSNGGFEAAGDGGALGWTTFNNTSGNVAASDAAAWDGTHSLRLAGQATLGGGASGLHQGVSVVEGMDLRASVHALVRSADGIVGTSAEAIMKIEFFDQHGASRHSSNFLGEMVEVVANSLTPVDAWRRRELVATAPAGAVEARLTLLFNDAADEPGAVYLDDAALTVRSMQPGDFNDDGIVDGRDFLAWQRGGSPAPLSSGDLAVWHAGYCATISGSTTAAAPEPAAWILTSLGAVVLLRVRKVNDKAHRPGSLPHA